jgi:predicted CoA-binding protein
MTKIPGSVAEFLRGKRIAVAGVSRDPGQAANAILRKLRQGGYEALPINPHAAELEGARCYPDLASIHGAVDGLVIATHPTVALELVRQAGACGVQRVWFHRSFGTGSVSQAAVDEGQALGLRCLVGGCPLMYCEPVDPFHRCLGAWLRWRGRTPR